VRSGALRPERDAASRLLVNGVIERQQRIGDATAAVNLLAAAASAVAQHAWCA